LVGWNYEAKRLDVLTDVANAFVDVLEAQEKLKLAEELVQLSEEISNAVIQRVRAGKDSPIEETKAHVALASARIALKQAAQRLTSARTRLAATWAGESAVFEKVAGRLDVVSTIPSEIKLRDLLKQNPDLARWAAEVQKQRAALKLEQARAIPDITLRGGIQRFNETDENAVVFGAAIPIPLFDRNQGGILEAKYNLAKMRRQQQAVEVGLYTTLAENYQALASAFVESTSLKNEVLPGARSAFDAARLGYREGKFDYLTVLDAQRTFFYAKSRYIESLAAYHKARANVERLIGQSLDGMSNSNEPKAQMSK
jgi:cobalt-zinc-cadmium efflux system outer membrane protein